MYDASNKKLHPQPGSHTDPAPGASAHENKASSHQPQTSVHPVEPEDPKTSTSRSRQSDALGLNVDGAERGHEGQPGHQAEEHPATPPGQHATGSFTEKKGRKSA